MVSQQGIEANPDKIQAILEMVPQKIIKEVQSLNGRVASLNKFVSRATNKCLSFFKTMKMSFEWTNECQKAFEDFKAYLASPLLLNPSNPNEELSLYLAISPMAISSALIREKDHMQLPVFYISRTLRGVEERYPPMENLAVALITVACKVRLYFQTHTIVVQMDKPLQKTMNNLEATERLVLRAIS